MNNEINNYGSSDARRIFSFSGNEIGNIYLFTDIDYNSDIVLTRPLVIIKELNDGNAFLAFKCTTREREYDEFSYKLNSWYEANLKQPSSVRCNKPMFINANTIVKRKDGSLSYIGRLTEFDLQNIAVRFDEYTNSMKQFAEEFKERVTSREYWFIREKSTSSNNREICVGTAKLFANESDAKQSFARCQAERNQLLYGGQVINCETSFELGRVRVKADGSYKETDMNILHRKRPIQTIIRGYSKGK